MCIRDRINAILIKSNESLINIGKALGLDTGEVREWQKQSKKAYKKKLWNKELGCFTTYDLRADKQIEHKEIGGILPIFAEIPTKTQAKKINKYLVDLHDRGFYICPSFDVDSPLFDSKRYWRGPIWPQMNWMIYHGLKTYGFEDTAKIVRSDLIELVQKVGFWEYFESQKTVVKKQKKGYGGDHFSWTASSIIDLIHNP